MNSLEGAIAHIEAVTGQEFGEWPGELDLERYRTLKKEQYLNQKGGSKLARRIFQKFTKEEELASSMYLTEEHAIVIIPKHKKNEFVYIHECAHAFEKNTWPRIFGVDINEEIMFLKESVNEGIADYLALLKEGPITTERCTELRGEKRSKSTTHYLLFEYADGPMSDERFKIYSTNKYALGLAIAEAAVAKADSVWKGLDELANNPPKTIDEAYEMIE